MGRAAALGLHGAGLPVYATGRDRAALAGLAEQGISTLRLDLTDEASAEAAVKRIVADHGAVGVLVNNAGSGVHGAVEEVPLDSVRDSFQTNLFGALRLTQLVLPGMREQGSGRIVNISSILGRLSPPGGALYHATKHALEAYSDSLRLEGAQFGVRVSLIEPAPAAPQFFAPRPLQFPGG